MDVRLEEIRSAVKTMLKEDEGRFTHTLGVASTAKRLARQYGLDSKKAEIAGLCHDICKCMLQEKMHRWASKGFDEAIIRVYSPDAMHALAGRMYCEKKLGIDDTDILDAIQYHVYGRPFMSMLEKIIFVSDYIEPSRTFVSDEIKILAFENLDEAVYASSRGIINHLKRTGKPVNHLGLKTLNAFRPSKRRN